MIGFFLFEFINFEREKGFIRQIEDLMFGKIEERSGEYQKYFVEISLKIFN